MRALDCNASADDLRAANFAAPCANKFETTRGHSAKRGFLKPSTLQWAGRLLAMEGSWSHLEARDSVATPCTMHRALVPHVPCRQGWLVWALPTLAKDVLSSLASTKFGPVFFFFNVGGFWPSGQVRGL